ncbi:MAG: hypothetical protein ABIU54_03300 [Candidatus Eisenbacteria bacterium]
MNRTVVTLFSLVMLAGALPASARILKTRPNPGAAPRTLPLTVGSGFEYDSDSEQSELGLPFLLEYSPLARLTLAIEPSYASIHTKAGGALSGFGDLETSATFGLLSERRNRPETAVITTVKWPTAANRELGTGYADYTVGALVSKSYVQADVELSVSYTLTGHPAGMRAANSHEVSLAIERDLTPKLDLIGEVLTGGGGAFGASTPGGRESEGTLGLAYQLSERLNLEQGVVMKSDGTWQLVFAWQWEFGDTR